MKIAIIGGGAAGLFAACRLGDGGVPFVLFEKNDRVGRKLAITGKGRCNLTNDTDAQGVLSAVTRNARFLYAAQAFFPPERTKAYFENELDVPLKTERGARVFPASDKASDVVGALYRRVLDSGSEVRFSAVSGLERAPQGGFFVTAGGRRERFDAVLLCTGGRSYPATGSDGFGYTLARELGHTVTPVLPSLVGLNCAGSACEAMQGLSLKNTGISVYDTESGKKIYEDFGELLFTHYGLSGPTILSASAHMRQDGPGRYEVRLDLKPALTETTLEKRLLSDFGKYSNRDLINALGDLLPSRMIPVFTAMTGVPAHKKVNEITKSERREIVKLLKEMRFRVKGLRPIEEAVVTCGGVEVKEVDPKTMESKRAPGLYFAGEILDVDAYTGGFNLQIAFSTAALAAKALTEAYRQKTQTAESAGIKEDRTIETNT